jgi:hypothetical protein
MTKIFYNIDTCGQFHAHFTHVTYHPNIISCIVNCKHAPMQCFQNTVAYLATAVSYTCKMFMKWTPGSAGRRTHRSSPRCHSSN